MAGGKRAAVLIAAHGRNRKRPSGGGGGASARGWRDGERLNITAPQTWITRSKDRSEREPVVRTADPQDAGQRKEPVEPEQQGRT